MTSPKTDAELADRLLVVFGLVEGPEDREDFEGNDQALDNTNYAMRLMRQLRALNPRARALILERLKNGETE
jgi:hypothetical protein